MQEYLEGCGEYLKLHEVDYYWEEYELSVIYDGHHPITGRRYHIVYEEFPCRLIKGAVVVGMSNFKLSGFTGGELYDREQ